MILFSLQSVQTNQYNEKLQLKFGVAYDEGAANDTYRTAGIPDASRYWASVGASYQATKQTTINAGFSHIRSQRVRHYRNG